MALRPPLQGTHGPDGEGPGGHGTPRIRRDGRTRVFGVGQLGGGGFRAKGLQSWCLHSQHGGSGGALSERTASTPCNRLGKTKGTKGEGQVRSHAAKA